MTENTDYIVNMTSQGFPNQFLSAEGYEEFRKATERDEFQRSGSTARKEAIADYLKYRFLIPQEILSRLEAGYPVLTNGRGENGKKDVLVPDTTIEPSYAIAVIKDNVIAKNPSHLPEHTMETIANLIVTDASIVYKIHNAEEIAENLKAALESSFFDHFSTSDLTCVTRTNSDPIDPGKALKVCRDNPEDFSRIMGDEICLTLQSLRDSSSEDFAPQIAALEAFEAKYMQDGTLNLDFSKEIPALVANELSVDISGAKPDAESPAAGQKKVVAK